MSDEKIFADDRIHTHKKKKKKCRRLKTLRKKISKTVTLGLTTYEDQG